MNENNPIKVEYEFLTKYKGADVRVPVAWDEKRKQAALQYYKEKEDKYNKRMELWNELRNVIISIPSMFKGKSPRPENIAINKIEFVKKGGNLD